MSDIHLDSNVLAALQDVMEDEYPVLLDTFLLDSEERLLGLRQAQQAADAQGLRLRLQAEAPGAVLELQAA